MLREVKLIDLRHAFFARASLNELDEKRVAFLEALVKGGAQLPPIQITPENEIIEGRHRLGVYQALGYETVQCEVVAGKSRLEYQALALKANLGGPKPPDRADLMFVVTQLQRDGASDTAVIGLLCPPLPKRMVKEQLDWNRSNERNLRFRAAMKLRNEEDLTFREAAERSGVSELELKEFVKSGGKHRKQGNKFIEIQRGFREPNQSYGNKITHVFTRTIQAFDDGLLTEEQAFELLRMPGDYGRKIVRRSDDAIERFTAHINAKKQLKVVV